MPVDADGNGINDNSEVQYVGHTGINPNVDAEGTGQNNLFKYVTGYVGPVTNGNQVTYYRYERDAAKQVLPPRHLHSLS